MAKFGCLRFERMNFAIYVTAWVICEGENVQDRGSRHTSGKGGALASTQTSAV
jgi:hypothetical protein